MKRNLSIFTYLLKESEFFSQAIYINTARGERKSVTDIFKPPRLNTLASYDIAGRAVSVVEPVGAFPLVYRSPMAARFAASAIARSVLRSIPASQPYYLWINTISPVECAVAEALAPGAVRVLFDSSDDLPTLEAAHMREDAERRLQRMLNLADDVLCVNSRVADGIAHPSKHVFRNCTTYSTLRMRNHVDLYPWLPKKQGAAYVGFIGSLHSDRVDTELLSYLFRRFPEYQFLFIGWISEPLKPLLAEHANAHILPEIPNDCLGTVIRSLDVSIVPHLDNRHTQGNDLLKILDCHACEVPVVTTPVSGVNTTEYEVLIASDHTQFGDYVKACVDGYHSLDLRRGAQIASSRSWEASIPELMRILRLEPSFEKAHAAAAAY